jgi:hypothetical protein
MTFVRRFGILALGLVLAALGFALGLVPLPTGPGVTYSGSYTPLNGIDMSSAMSSSFRLVTVTSFGPPSIVALLFGFALVGGWVGYRVAVRVRNSENR